MGKIHYKIKIEIFKGEACSHHRLGEIFSYPEDTGKICPWLLDSIHAMIRVLQYGGTLPWTYRGTEFEKQIDQEGTTTEFVRCPDPTDAGVVVRITRRRLKLSDEVGWS